MKSLISQKDSLFFKPNILFFVLAICLLCMSYKYSFLGIIAIYIAAGHGLITYWGITNPEVAEKYSNLLWNIFNRGLISIAIVIPLFAFGFSSPKGSLLVLLATYIHAGKGPTTLWKQWPTLNTQGKIK